MFGPDSKAGNGESKLSRGCVMEKRELEERNHSLSNLEKFGIGKAGKAGERGAVFGFMPWGIWPRLNS